MGDARLVGRGEGIEDRGPQISSPSQLLIRKSLGLGNSAERSPGSLSLTSLGADSEISVLVSLPNAVTEYRDNSNLVGKRLILAHGTRTRAFRC